jgi:hypothetical protein
MLQWRIYYTNGSTFDSSMGTWKDAPGYGIAGILQLAEDSGRAMVLGVDFYWFDEVADYWSGGDYAGFLDYVTNVLGLVKQARTVARHEEWRKIKEQMILDPDFPPLSKPFKQAHPPVADMRGEWST